MRRITTTLIFAVILHGVLLASAITPEGSISSISGLFGYDRSDKEDVVALIEGGNLYGKVLDEVIGINTIYGDLFIPIEKCAGIAFPMTPESMETIITTNYNRITGTIYNKYISFKESSTGQIKDIRKDKIRNIFFERTLQEAAALNEVSTTCLMIMSNGDILTGRLNLGQIEIREGDAKVILEIERITSLTIEKEEALTAKIITNSGLSDSESLGTQKMDIGIKSDVIKAALLTEELNLNMDIGTKVEFISTRQLYKMSNGMRVGDVAEAFYKRIEQENSIEDAVTDTLDTEIALRIPNSLVELQMKLIPAGLFIMGSNFNEKERYADEGPQHEVTISKPFYMGAYEVTQAQWEAVMGDNPSGFKGNPNNPVEKVSWDDCQGFIKELNTMGLGTFRLPTEAEWEYACRAGSTTRFPWGDDPSYNQMGQYAWYSGNSYQETHPVGQKKPNAWGLFDMQGNVWEWCSDRYYSYSSGSQTDPQGPVTGTARVIRGGSWNNLPQDCRSSFRNIYAPVYSFNFLGFRLVKVVL